MSEYLETGIFDSSFKFRTFINDGMCILYPHWHKEIEIIYSKKGTINIGLNEELIQLQEGEIVFMASGDIHYFLASPGSERYVFLLDLSMFKEDDLRAGEESLSELFSRGERYSKKWPESLQTKMTKLLEEIYHDFYSEQPGKNYQVLAGLYKLIGNFYQELPLQVTEHSANYNEIQYKDVINRLNDIFAYVEQHYQEKIQLKDIAAHAGFSQYYFTRFFKKSTGQTFMEFLVEYRITQAKYILATEKIPMADLAERVGFVAVEVPKEFANTGTG